MGVVTPPDPEQLVVLTELIEANNDATLEELRYLLYQKIGVAISRATLGRMTKLLNMTLKKNTLPERERH
jgi:transposase